MRKVNLSKKAALTAAVFSVGFLVQACGSGSGSSTSAQTTSNTPCVQLSNGTCLASGVVPTATNSTLYGACSNIYSAQSAGVGQVLQAEYVNSPDGTASVCQVAMEQVLQYSGSRVYLGPNEPNAQGMSTPVTVYPYDELAILDLSGAESSGFFANCSSGGNSISSIAYGYIQGVGLGGYFLLDSATASDPIVIPANIAGGQLLVGLNQSAGSSGCFTLNAYAVINRCVDSSGTPHPCPAGFIQ